MKGCLLSRKVKLLRNLIDLKAVAHQFALASSRLAFDADEMAPVPEYSGTGAPCPDFPASATSSLKTY